jgi:phage/plasmid-like protein (TIGR03299 family)
MPADFETGFTVRQPAWHRQGTVLDDYPGSWAEAAKAAGLDWEPVKTPVYDRELVGMDEVGEPTYRYVEVPERAFVKRSDTLARLDVATAGYNVIPNAAMGEIVEALVGEGARYSTAGSLQGGRKVWALAEIAEPVRVKGDPSETLQYCALLNSHDGSAALQAVATNVRVVCMNTWKATELDGDRHGHAYSFRHTSGWRERLDEAKQLILFGRAESQLVIDELNALVDVKVTARQMEIFVQDFVPMPVGDIVSDQVVTNVEVARQALRDIMASPTCVGINGTAYGLVQAAGEYLDHVRTVKTYSSYVNRTLLSAEKLKYRAKRLALAVAAG